jgi:HEAT repeat protein
MKIEKLFRPNIERHIKKKNVPALIRCIKKRRYPYVQQKAVRVLGNFRDSRATQPLLELVTKISTDRSLHYDAIVSLGKIGDATGIAFITELLEKGNEHYRSAAISALRHSHTDPSPVIVSLLIHNMYDSKAYISIHAAETLKKLKCKPEAFNDRVRFYAMNNMQNELVKIGKDAVEPLIKILEAWYPDPDAAFLMKNIIKVLTTIGDRRAIEPIMQVRTNYSYADIILTINHDVQEALIAFGEITAKPLIDKLENEKNAKKQERIIYLLHRVTGQNFKNDIEAWKKWIEDN